MIQALKRWRNILLGRKFAIEVDNKALEYIHTSKDRMVLDWVDFLLEFDMTISYKKGILNILPHHLSHLYELVVNETAEHQREGGVLNILHLRLDSQSSSEVAARMSEFIKNVIMREEPPLEERQKIVAERHAETHNGPEMLFRTIFQEGFYWQSLFADCDKECSKCNECLRFNVGKVGFHPLSPLTAAMPWDHIVIDLIGPFLTTEDGYNFILIVVDVLTRFVILRPLRSKSAEEVAMTLLLVFADFGAPKILQCDRDKAFLNQVMGKMKEFVGFELRGFPI